MIVLLIGLIGAAAGGWWGWRSGTNDLYRPSLDPLDPPLSSAASSPRGQARGRARRLIKTTLFAVLGFAAGIVLLFVLNRR